ncbi:hypothetical protein GS894_23860 [Rhodococcus hoagii]|nr:hypothetical protein [Prescottella equi]NKT12015.1 hypothetical protein [Prescottella equi]NKT16265.1 hypothetical protein [Prescottella equi]NKT36046.1 hypothetical protein [Prescottella equi]NKT37662.1 hypothetical protein [Prescottella equi]
MSDSDATRELTELARRAAWGLVMGGDLDSLREDGRAALLERWNILDAAERAGITVDLKAEGIGEIYSREFLEGLVQDFRPRDPRTGRVVR